MSQATAPPDSQSLQTVEHRDWVKKSVARRRGSRRTKPVRKLSRDGRESPADADNRSGAGRNPAAMTASTLSPPYARPAISTAQPHGHCKGSTGARLGIRKPRRHYTVGAPDDLSNLLARSSLPNDG